MMLKYFAQKGGLKGKRIAVWGLAFKPDTDDMRDAPAITIIKALQSDGARIQAYDPIAKKNAEKILEGITLVDSAYDAAKDAEVLLVVTEWNEFKELDLKKVKDLMSKPNLLDGRNIYDPQTVKNFGFNYLGVGRK